jgi:hypothetical protein
MDKFTAYASSTGEILFSGEASEPGLLANSSQDILVGESYSGGWIDGDVFFAIPVQPSPNHTFNYTTKLWEDPRTLADVKTAKNSAINRARATANSSTFTFQSKQIAVDQLSRSDIDATHGAILMLQALPPGWPGAWKAVDNTFIAIPDVATWGQFYGAMVATGTANFNHSQVLKAQLAAASTVGEVEAVADW